eukprot:GHVU01216048.1.p1 GENE.GHVU01216048.1~~GHVU01216048.1.p1  ORF type:complete len:188 (+),score=13.16 GHVU01216048.1:478-1041(+)
MSDNRSLPSQGGQHPHPHRPLFTDMTGIRFTSPPATTVRPPASTGIFASLLDDVPAASTLGDESTGTHAPSASRKRQSADSDLQPLVTPWGRRQASRTADGAYESTTQILDRLTAAEQTHREAEAAAHDQLNVVDRIYSAYRAAVSQYTHLFAASTTAEKALASVKELALTKGLLPGESRVGAGHVN